MAIADNARYCRILNERTALEQRWKGGHMPKAVVKKLVEMRYAETAEWTRMIAEQARLDALDRDKSAPFDRVS